MQMLHKIGYGHFLANHSLFAIIFCCMALEAAQAQMLIQQHKITISENARIYNVAGRSYNN
jgi:hypothetical protein